MTAKPNIREALHRLATAEDQFLASRFLAPVVRGRGVETRIARVRCRLHIQPRDFAGWGILRPLSHTQATLERPAQLTERRRYLDLFPALSAVLCRREGSDWLAAPASASDRRFRIEGLFRVDLVDEADLFDSVRIRFDGSSFWFDQLDPRADPGAGAYLRQCLSRMLDPKDLVRPGLTAQQAAAYQIVHAHRIRQAAADEHQRAQHRLGSALSHAGAQLREFSDRGEVYRVSYDVDGRRHTSIVRKHDLTIHSAGICLSGGDGEFDLHSLVGVLREGEEEGTLVRVPANG